MPTDLIRFPGDPITADVWNRMLGLIDGLNARLDANEALVVPDVVGDLFPAARDEIVRAQLGLNTVFDVEGTKADPDDPVTASHTVVGQTPGPDERVPSGTRMTLLITAPKVVKTGAPTITAAAPATNAQIGQPLDLTGTNFANARVIIRGTELLSTQFQVLPDGVHIHIPKVPPFEGSPAPGTSKDIPITVRNNVGEGSFIVKFSEAAIPAARPTVSNVRLVDTNLLRLIGTNLVQSGQDTSVTMGGEERQFLPQSDGSVIIPLPEAMASAFRALSPQVFTLLKNLDQKDVLLVTIGTNNFDRVDITDAVVQPLAARVAQPAAAAPASDQFTLAAGAIPVGAIGTIAGLRFTTTMKLFLILSSRMATSAQNGAPKVSGNTVSLEFQGNTILSVDVTKLQDVPVVVKVGDKSATFPVKFGSVPDNTGGGKTVLGGQVFLNKSLV
jgi:hypothetical protein